MCTRAAVEELLPGQHNTELRTVATLPVPAQLHLAGLLQHVYWAPSGPAALRVGSAAVQRCVLKREHV